MDLCVCDVFGLFSFTTALEQQKGDKSMFHLLAIVHKLLFRFSDYQRLTEQGFFSFLLLSILFKEFFIRSPVLVQVLSNKGRREDS